VSKSGRREKAEVSLEHTELFTLSKSIEGDLHAPWDTEAMSIEELVRAKREAILAIAAQRGARNVRVFGSVARGEADEQSDVDFLVDMDPDRSLLDLGGLLMDLRALLGRDVDVMTPRTLKPRIRVSALRDAIAL
jgi:predicted nucleotidyltransferase